MSFIINIIHFMHDTFPKVTAHLNITYINFTSNYHSLWFYNISCVHKERRGVLVWWFFFNMYKKFLRNWMFLSVLRSILLIHFGHAVYFHVNSSKFNSALGIDAFFLPVFMYLVLNVLFTFVHDAVWSTSEEILPMGWCRKYFFWPYVSPMKYIVKNNKTFSR